MTRADKRSGPPAEPIAIVGMACRFPGAPDLDAFWRLLVEGGNAVTEGVPGSGVGRVGEIIRDPDVQNPACRFGAFVDDIDQFDASFFRISPVEAELLDPQQRMMLETTWQALEDAAIDPARLSGSRTGVYTGISNDEYRMLVVDSSRPTEAAGSLYALSGTNLNGASGRVSFFLGLMGPAKAVDAACASAMVAVHDAVQDLQFGKADLAIAGGVQAILNGRIYELRADAMMLSPDGQCKTFDASANGYVRGEGCGVVVLKRLSDAEADGDRIWAVIRGSAVNHGGASVGLTVPHTPALEQVMATALAEADVPPSDVDYVEAHGTGTAVGDPIELDAVAAVYGRERDANRPLLMGSVKTNLGHLESAAGVAGLIKAALVVKRGVIPKHLHFENPHPSFDWDRQPLQVTATMEEWPPDRRRPRLAGVNSFGISGTNAHLVVGEYPGSNGTPSEADSPTGATQDVGASLPASLETLPLPKDGLVPRQTRILPLSGKSEDALKDLAKRYSWWIDESVDGLDSDDAALADSAWTAGVGRSHFDHRASAVFHDAKSLRERLDALADSQTGVEPRSPATVAFVYTGQGSQWVGMGRALYETEPVARAVLDRCEAVFRDARGASLLDVMFGRAGAEGDLGDTAWEQPALYALECALTALWSSVGVRPSVVLGHSVGEIAAAQAAGVFSLEDGMRFAAARGSLLSGVKPGAMAAIFAPAARVAAEVEALNAASNGVALSIAADNGAHMVVSGPTAGIEAVLERAESEGIRARRLNTTRAFHSALVEPALDGLEASLDGVAIGTPTLTVVSNLTGHAVKPGMALDAAYWRRHARQPVAFASGVRAMADLGVDLVLEIGPHAVLGPMATLAWPEDAADAPVVLASLRRPPRDAPTPEPETGFVDAVAEAYEAGLDISFEGLFASESRRRVALPGYPFQRERYWLEASKQRRTSAGHPLLGVRHESARGEITFETEVLPSDPVWLNDHKVFDRLVAPGALYGAMAASACLAEGNGSIVVDDMQLHSPLVFSEKESADGSDAAGRKIQVVLDAAAASSRQVQIFSQGAEREWTTHVECRVAPDDPLPDAGERIDLEALEARLAPADVPAYYSARSATGVDLGPFFRTLGRAWSGPGEALAEVALPEAVGRNQLDVHPLVLDGCFQVVGVARNVTGAPDEATYLPFGWERFWLRGRMPDRVLCHVRMSEASREAEAESGEPPEVLSGELRLYDPSGVLIGELSGYTVKRATRAALLAAIEGVEDLLYEIAWRERVLPPGIEAADFFPSPAEVAAGSQVFPGYLTDAGVDPAGRNALLADLERWSRSRALATLEELGWRRAAGEVVDPEDLRQRLDVLPEHQRVFRRMFEMLANSGVVEETEAGFEVVVGPEDPLPDHMPRDVEEFATWMAETYPDGQIEVGLFRRSGRALADVLRGNEDPLTLLFSSGEPTAADLYLKAPVARAANQMLSEAVQALVAALPEGRRLRVIEVGAGTGSATASVLPELPEGRFDYTYTDISAGFFAEAEARFGSDGIDYRPLDIERDPIAQGFDAHGYDVLIASNVLHATRFLQETLGHCRELLAPSGHLVALENLRGLGWMDLTFGQLDGWWRFADDYRPHHALAEPSVWRRALGDVGFAGVEVLGVDDSFTFEMLDKGVIVAQGPAQVAESPGLWVLTSDRGGVADELSAALAARNQTVVLAGRAAAENGASAAVGSGIVKTDLEPGSRESWQALLEGLPANVPFNGVVHLAGLDGHGRQATTAEIAEDVTHAGASALAMVQGLADSDLVPEQGLWFVTTGAQVIEREQRGQLAGAVLWGLGKVVTLEAAHLQPRMLDLDPGVPVPLADLVNELLYPDQENHIAYRSGSRRVARLVRPGAAGERLELPEDPDWVLAPDRSGIFDSPEIKPLPVRSLEPREVRVSVEATGLNFWDVFRSLGFIEEGDLGREMCGHVLDVGADVSSVGIGDRVVGLGFGAFGPEMITREELVAPAPAGMSVSALATIPSAFVSAALSYHYSGLEAGDRVLIHAGAGGVGLAAIQLAQAAGAEVFATASAPKQAYLRSVGVEHLFDSRQTKFGEEILEATGGEGVDVVLNSLTSEGFIEASLSCLARGGRFVELARRDILSHEEMAALRPDVSYNILELDVLKKTDPAWVGEVLREVMERLTAGELQPVIHSRWPLAEAGAALSFMRSARHIGKIVLTPPPLMRGRLRPDRTYLVTGGLGGIGCAVAEWLAEHGAGAIVLNGRRDPDPEAQAAIDALRGRGGVRVEVELADVTDTAAIDQMLARIDATLPPLGGVIHSVGVLSDAALSNQTWASFERVLWPKIVGAWRLHRATMDRDLDLFILFSSRVGVMGNPGQANHAAANAFLDQLAGHRRALGLPGQSIAWGAWSEIGEAAEQRERIEQRRAALGGRWFTPQQGIQALERLVRQDTTTSVVMSMDWSVFAEAVQDRPPLLEDMLTSDADDEADAAASSEDLLTQLRSAPTADPEQVLVSFLQRELQAVLRLTTTPSPTVGFFDLGMDSLMAVELRNRLNRAFADEYVASNTLVFDYPDVASLARHLVGELGQVGGAAPLSAPEAPEPAPQVQHEDDGIAIIGIACRFPGSDDPLAFWRQLEAGVDSVTEGRDESGSWFGAFGDPAADDPVFRRGGFIDGIEWFDSRFFRIAPIEARMMDPRQRMLLETTWHALEDAGIDPEGLRGSRTGVYIGFGGNEYRDVIAASGQDDSYVGTAGSMTVGRLAYVLGLEGPAMPLDMVCASSLVAVHQAMAGLQRGEADLALAGGANTPLSPGITRFLNDFGMLSATGRSRAFDEAADGFVQSDGCGVLVLKRLRDAEAAGDRIWGVLRGSAINQSGASAGLTVPNGPAQERVLEEALARAGVDPADVDYLEAHGAGSPLGDPIEVHAAAAVYGRGRDPDRPLVLGSVKANIGHTEWAAGIASLIKTVLAMQQRMIPRQLHFTSPSPEIDWNRLPVRVASDNTPWPPASDRPPLAAVSAFGMSGTNANVVVAGYDSPQGPSVASGDVRVPAGAARPAPVTLPESLADLPVATDGLAERQTRLLPLSARSDQALRELAARYLAWLDEQGGPAASNGAVAGVELADMAWTASVGRSHLDYRAGVVFHDAASLDERLRIIAQSPVEPRPETPRRVAFAYTGQGGQWTGMGRTLYESEPVVRAVLDRCDAVVRDERGSSLLDVMLGRGDSAGDLSDTAWAHPAIYALECALTALWASLGVRPGVMVGHGLGEIAAAQAAGVFSLEDGLRFALARGALMSALPGPGLALEGSLEAALSDVAVASPSSTLVSGVTGRAVASDDALDAAYWHRQAREPVAFDRCVETLATLDVDVVVEIGPDVALGPQVAPAWPDATPNAGAAPAPVVIGSLRRPDDDGSTAESAGGFVEAVAAAYEAGLPIAFPGLFAGETRRRVPLPNYPFQRRHHWA